MLKKSIFKLSCWVYIIFFNHIFHKHSLRFAVTRVFEQLINQMILHFIVFFPFPLVFFPHVWTQKKLLFSIILIRTINKNTFTKIKPFLFSGINMWGDWGKCSFSKQLWPDQLAVKTKRNFAAGYVNWLWSLALFFRLN